jgi:hypothetical protein
MRRGAPLWDAKSLTLVGVISHHGRLTGGLHHLDIVYFRVLLF